MPIELLKIREPLKILALLTDGLGAKGGIAKYNQALLTALSKSEQVGKVVVLARFGSASAAAPDKILQLAPVKGRIAWSAQALKLSVIEGFDVIFCGHLNAAWFAALLSKAFNRPLWLQAHGIEAWERRGVIQRRAIESASLITAVSRYTRARLLSWCNLEPHQVRVLPNTVDAVFAIAPKPQYLLDRYALNGKRVILTVGRLSAQERYKGHDRIIRSMPEVLRRCPNTVYLIVGSGDDRARLEAEARAANVTDFVIFAGEAPNQELPAFFHLADVYAMPSTGEGFGIVFLEAAASGLPIVAGNRDGSVDALADGALGSSVDPDNSQQLADILVRYLSRDQVAPRTEAQARFASGNFNTRVDHLVRALATAC